MLELAELFRELPEACANTMLIAERVESYNEVFEHVDRMPQFPDVPEGETQVTYLQQKIAEGLAKRYGDQPRQDILERIDFEMSIIGPMGFASYFLVVADICQYARDNGIPVGPGRGSAAGSMVAYLTRITELDPIEHDLLFERFLNPERVNPPDVDIDFDDRQRDRMVRYVTDKYGQEYTAQVNTFGTIKAKAAVKDANRILGYPFALGDRITKAMPPDVMGKGVPLRQLFDKNHPRYNEGTEIRALYENEPDVRKIVDTGMGIEGLIRGTGGHAAAVVLVVDAAARPDPAPQRDKDGVIITGFDYRCENMGLVKMDFLGLREPRHLDDAIKVIDANRGIEINMRRSCSTTPPPTISWPAETSRPLPARWRPYARPAPADEAHRVRGHLRRRRPVPARPHGRELHTNYALRKTGSRTSPRSTPNSKTPAEVLGPTYRPGRLPRAGPARRAGPRGYSLGQADLLRRAMGKKKPEVLAKESSLPGRLPGTRLLRRGDPSGVGRPGAVRRLRLQQVPLRRLRLVVVLDGLPQGELSRRVRRCAAHVGVRRQGQVGDLPCRCAQRRHQVRPGRHESVADFTAVGSDVRSGCRRYATSVTTSSIRWLPPASARKVHLVADFLEKVDLPACNKRAVDSLHQGGCIDSLGHTRWGWSPSPRTPSTPSLARRKKPRLVKVTVGSVDDADVQPINRPTVDDWDGDEGFVHRAGDARLTLPATPARASILLNWDMSIADLLRPGPRER